MLRKPDSIPAGDTLIEDPVMEPFFIKGENQTPYIKTICYPSTFNSALKATARELLNSKNVHYKTITSYIKEWRDIQEKLSILTGIE